ncbi:MAG: YaaL family protein [Agathobacter sp.]|nr:YaaL family protein [Agathobacter sp.]
MKLFKFQKEEENKPYMLLKDDIEKTTSELNAAYTNMQNVTDPDLIDYYIYQTKAVQMRYRYLLSCAKKLEDSYTKNPL